jgi:molecular chaperone HscA
MALLQISEPGKSQDPHNKKFYVGIDLGTTNSLVALIQNGAPNILKDKNNNELFPSVVNYSKASVTVGKPLDIEDQISFSSIKRLIGKGINDIDKDEFYSPCKYHGDDNILKFEVFDKLVTPIEISSEILRHLKNITESTLNGNIEGCVITVPAYFDDAQRQATKDAAKLCGLNTLRLLNEPTAAAIAYGLDNKEVSKVMVYDLGGGTFDVSILSLDNGVFKVLATGGDSALGGDDFDTLLADYIQNKLKIDLDIKKKYELFMYAKEIKEILTDNESVNINLDKIGIKDKELIISRLDFEKITDRLVKRTLEISEGVLSDSNLSTQDLDEIILVGGSTRMPNIKNFVKIFFNKEPLSNINPDNVVAVGASIQANIMSGNSSEELLLLDVIPLSLGIETMGELVEVIIPRNSTIPTSSSKEYTTFKDGQSAMSIHVVQGERDIVSDCRSLAKFTVNDIPPMLAGAARVRLEFQIDANGILSINATETTTGKVTSVEVKPSYGITDSDIEKMLKDSIDNAEEDIKNRHLKEAVVEGNRVILAIKSALDIDGSELLSEEEQNEISHAIENLEKKLKGSNKDNIINAIKSLENVCETYVERRMNSNIQKIMKGTDIKEYN